MYQTRIDRDPMGPVELPAGALYGPGAGRAMTNFAISGRTLGMIPELTTAFGQLKAASALANLTIGVLDEEKAAAIVRAADEVADQELNGDLVVDVFEGSGGTSLNMNVNEVIANRAAQLLDTPVGAYDVVHPNDHVNRCQSTNDVVPSAIKIACRLAMAPLLEQIDLLSAAFEERTNTFGNVLRLGRTCLQDAQPMTLGQSFGAHATLMKRLRSKLRVQADELLALPIGATAIGTGFGAEPGYRESFFEHLRARTGCQYAQSEDPFDALANADVFSRLSGELRTIAISVAKVANDFILLSSGPAAGLAELHLPSVQPGSSIMPGKINPVIPMAMVQIGFTLAGYDAIVSAAVQQGQLEINPYEPVIVFHLLEGARLLANGLRLFRERCVIGIEPDVKRMADHLRSSSAIATAMLPVLGYEMTSNLVKRSVEEGRAFADLAIAEGLIRSEDMNILIGRAVGMGKRGRS